MIVVHIKQSVINTALIVGKITCGLLSNRIATGYYNGDSDHDGFADLAKTHMWVDALNEFYEIDEITRFEWQNYLTEDAAKEVIEKINRVARKHLPPLIINKVLQNQLQLV